MEAAILILTRISIFIVVRITDSICERLAFEVSSPFRIGHLLSVV